MSFYRTTTWGRVTFWLTHQQNGYIQLLFCLKTTIHHFPPLLCCLCVGQSAECSAFIKELTRSGNRKLSDKLMILYLKLLLIHMLSCQVTFAKLRQSKYTTVKGLIKKKTHSSWFNKADGGWQPPICHIKWITQLCVAVWLCITNYHHPLTYRTAMFLKYDGQVSHKNAKLCYFN